MSLWRLASGDYFPDPDPDPETAFCILLVIQTIDRRRRRICNMWSIKQPYWL